METDSWVKVLELLFTHVPETVRHGGLILGSSVLFLGLECKAMREMHRPFQQRREAVRNAIWVLRNGAAVHGIDTVRGTRRCAAR